MLRELLRTLCSQNNSRTCCQEILAVATTHIYPSLKWFGQDCLCLSIDTSRLPRLDRQWQRLSLNLQVLVSWYHFWARLRLPPTRLLVIGPCFSIIRNLMTACRKNLSHRLDIANPFPLDLVRLCAWIWLLIWFMNWLCMVNLFPPDLWDYMHGFGH